MDTKAAIITITRNSIRVGISASSVAVICSLLVDGRQNITYYPCASSAQHTLQRFPSYQGLAVPVAAVGDDSLPVVTGYVVRLRYPSMCRAAIAAPQLLP